MTTCTPIRPFRCWQYRKDSTEPVPEWADEYLEFYSPMNDGEWLVQCGGNGAMCGVWLYTPAEFQERFRVEEGK
jgi:hypothetical protein